MVSSPEALGSEKVTAQDVPPRTLDGYRHPPSAIAEQTLLSPENDPFCNTPFPGEIRRTGHSPGADVAQSLLGD